MMFGTKDTFHYFFCDYCRCLLLIDPPDDLSPYYPSDKYYAFRESEDAARSAGKLRQIVKRIRDRTQCLSRGGPLGWLVRNYPNYDALDIARWLKHTNVRSHRARILDVGCGHGELLSMMHSLGFTSLTGIDPFAPREITTPFRICRQSIDSLVGHKFDLVMMHHSLEHMPDQHLAMQSIQQILAEDGVCLIRIPITSQGPWKMYGTDWVEIDAPRHFIIHSEFSLSLAARQAGLAIAKIQYESEPFSYGVSEMYQRDIPLIDMESNESREWSATYSKDDLARFDHMAKEHSVPGWAGRAAFYLTHSDSKLHAESVEVVR